MPKTYEPISTQTLATSATTVTFTSIPQTYTDLVLVISSKMTTGDDAHGIQFNGDTAGNYSATGLYGSSGVAGSYRGTNSIKIDAGRIGTDWCNSIIHIMNYSNTTTYKTVLSRGNNTATTLVLVGALWRSTSAISSMVISAYNNQSMLTGSTFTLYGIKAA